MAKATIARQSIVQQLHDLLIDMLRDEQYTAGSSLPSEFELAERFSVSRATIREALKGLVQEGLLDCRHGKGYFVLSREAVIHKPITQWQSVTDLMADMGYPVANRVLRAREESPTPQVRRALQLEGQTVVHLERVRISRDEPLIYSVDIFPRAFISGLLQEQDWSGSLINLFDERWQVQIVSSRARIRAATLSAQLCAEIGVPAHTAWLYMEQVNVTKDGRPVLFSQDYHRGENFDFHVTRRRY